MTVELRPRRLVVVCRVAGISVLLIFAAIAVVLPEGSVSGRAFGIADQLSFFTIGLLLALGVLALSRPRVRADGRGIWVRNVLGERYFPWEVVASIELPDGGPWAQLELHDDQSVALLALQSNDGQLALDGVATLRARLAASRDSQL